MMMCIYMYGLGLEIDVQYANTSYYYYSRVSISLGEVGTLAGPEGGQGKQGSR